MDNSRMGKKLTKGNMIDNIMTIKGNLPKKQKKICDYIVEHSSSIGLLTVKDLAKAAGTGTTTVIRLMQMLGYENFSEFKRNIHEASEQSSLSTWWHMKKSFLNEDNHSPDTLTQVWNEVLMLLDKTFHSSLAEQFKKTIDLMLKASSINILGLRSSKAPAIYFGYLLEAFYPKIQQLSMDSEFVYDRILKFEKNELLFLIVHSPYTQRSIEAAQYCHEKGIPIVLVTDLLSCPIAPIASAVLKIQGSEKQYSIVPTIALLEAIVIEFGRQTSMTSIRHLDELGKLLQEKNITCT